MGFGLYLTWATPTRGSAVESLYPMRYFLCLMGFFSIFAGLCYNDFTSLPTYMFGDSCYTFIEGEANPTWDSECVYPVGVDPSWYLSTNEIAFINSLKMKIAVIFGVAQMCQGICLKGLNYIHYRLPIDFLFVFVPQIVMMTCLFGFMDCLIVIKWMTDFTADTSVAPSIITMTIDMGMSMGIPTDPKVDALILPQAKQTEVMKLLMMIIGVCIPLMLCVKPIYQICFGHHDSKVEESTMDKADQGIDDFKRAEPLLVNESQFQLLTAKDDAYNVREDLFRSLGIEPPKPHDSLEMFIHQMIETIEFVLGAVSNTASYLRLWALSLAHSQLSKVFYD